MKSSMNVISNRKEKRKKVTIFKIISKELLKRAQYISGVQGLIVLKQRKRNKVQTLKMKLSFKHLLADPPS